MKTVWYNPEDMQIMAVYRNCRYGGDVWQKAGYVEAAVANGVKVSRDHKVDNLRDGVVTAVSANTNSVQPAKRPELTDVQKLERTTGMSIERLKALLA